MTPRKSPPSGRKSETPQDQLQQSIGELSQNVRSLMDVMEQVREELTWLARNGVPHQPLALSLNSGSPAVDAPSEQQADSPSDSEESPVTSKVLEQACDWLGENFASLLEEQLGMIVESQEGIKKQLLQAITGELPGKKRQKENLLPTNSVKRDSDETPLLSSSESVANPVSTATDIAGMTDHCPSRVRQWELGDAVEFTVDGREVWGEMIAFNDAENSATVLIIPSEEEITVSQDLLTPEYGSQRDRQPLSPLTPDNLAMPAAVSSKPVSGRLF